MQQPLTQPTYVKDICWLGLTISVFYLLFLGHYPLINPDEARYAEVTREMLANHQYLIPHLNSVIFFDKPILFYWLQSIPLRFFSINPWTIRLIPACFGILTCMITYYCTRYLSGRLTAILSTVILATSPLFFFTSHYANMDLLVAFFMTATLLAFLLASETQNVRLQKWLFISIYPLMSLGVMSKGLIAIVLPGLIITAWLLWTKQWQILRKCQLLKGTWIMLFILGTWIIVTQYQQPTFIHQFFYIQHFQRFLSNTFNNQRSHFFYLPIIVLGLLPWSSLLVQAITYHIKLIYNKQPNYQQSLFLLLWPTVIVLFFSVPHSKIIGYIVPACPPLAILIARYCEYKWQSSTTAELRWTKLTYNGLIIIFTSAILFTPLFDKISSLLPRTEDLYILLATIGILALITLSAKSYAQYCLILMTNSSLLLLTMLFSLQYVDTGSIKPLITLTNQLNTNHDEVVNYYYYYQEVPLTLQHPITVVANWEKKNPLKSDTWKQLFADGLQQSSKPNPHFINFNTFDKQWTSQKRLYVFIRAKILPNFYPNSDRVYIIARYKDAALITNKPAVIGE